MKQALFTILILVLSTLALQAQWQADVRLTNNTSSSNTSYNNSRCVAASGDTVHVVWEEFRNGNLEIYYKRTTDCGITWGNDIRLTNDPNTSLNASIAISNSFVHVVWFDDRNGNFDIYYIRSTDGGSSWGAETQITTDPNNSGYPSVSALDSLVYIVWGDHRNGIARDVYYMRSADNGSSWGPETQLTNNPGDIRHVSIALSGLDIHALWIDDRDGNYEVYYKRSSDSGTTWGPDTRLTNTPALSEYPLLTASGSIIHVVWSEGPIGTANLFYKRSTDGGLTWQADIQMTNNSTKSSTSPSVAISDSLVHLIWQDNRDGNKEIYYNQSFDEGLTWGTDTRLTNNVSVSENPFIAVSGTKIHAVWQDVRDGNYEIYYKINPTGNVVGLYEISIDAEIFKVFPNPVLDEFRILFSENINEYLHNSSDGLITIHNVSGKEIYRNSNFEKNEMSIETHNFESGIYLVKFQSMKFQDSKKLIILR